MGQTASTSLKALAFSVLAAGKRVPPHTSALPTHGTGKDRASTQKSNNLAACGSIHCAGCYEVEPSVRIHPPRSSEEWKEWLLKWEPKGKVQ
jgi:hypothetical protein